MLSNIENIHGDEHIKDCYKPVDYVRINFEVTKFSDVQFIQSLVSIVNDKIDERSFPQFHQFLNIAINDFYEEEMKLENINHKKSLSLVIREMVVLHRNCVAQTIGSIGAELTEEEAKDVLDLSLSYKKQPLTVRDFMFNLMIADKDMLKEVFEFCSEKWGWA